MIPTAFFVIGPAGSGKSSVSRLLAGRAGATYLDKDSVATYFTETLLQLAGTDPHERDNNEYYQRVVMDLEYQTLLRLAGDNLRLGTSVVLDAPFVRYFAQPDFVEGAARRHSWPDATRTLVVHVTVESEIVRERVAVRNYERDTWKLGRWDQFWANAQAVECTWRGAHHVQLDNSVEGVNMESLERVIPGFK